MKVLLLIIPLVMTAEIHRIASNPFTFEQPESVKIQRVSKEELKGAVINYNLLSKLI